ncbi:MAG: Fe-S cluster assembly protein SufD [Epsilonproteobacteria bacterium]|nr:MAG: Fe-S cluster assembly protein SufD [Campylobacterota bacterium]RLA67339.1 MAG: Fe-S cluster assembly protein SufD [Campylobacterota bacterium]
MNDVIKNYIDENTDYHKHLEGKFPQMEKALKKLSEIGFPTKKLENWKYTNVTPLLKDHLKLNAPLDTADIESFLIKTDGPLMVFINGHFIEEKSVSVPGLHFKVKSLSNSLPEFDESSEESFDLLNLSSLNALISVKVGKDTLIESPLQILHLSTEKMNGYRSHSRVEIKAEAYSKLDILETFAHLGKKTDHYLVNPLTNIKVGEGAKVEHIKAGLDSLSSLNIGKVKAIIGKDAFFNSFTFTIGGKLGRNNLDVSLAENGAEAHVHGVFALGQDQHCDIFSIIDHKVAHTNSEQLFKGLLDESAHGVFTGKIIVNPQAQLINSRQASKNLLLSKKARINTRPILEIYADDVKCSHGATIGQLNENEIFYLESRGIPKEKAQRMLCQGFAQEGINTISNPLIKEKITGYFKIYLKGQLNEL